MLGRLRHLLFLYLNLPERRFVLQSRLTRPWYRWRLGAYGADSILVSPRMIRGGHKIAVGESCWIWPDCTLSVERSSWDIDGPRLTLGKGVVLQTNITITCAERIELDDHAAIGSNTLISDNDHTIDGSSPSILGNPIISSPIRIGKGVWVGNNVAIVRGAQIGDYAVIGANSVVRSEIPPYAIAVGAPARVVGTVPHPDTAKDAVY